MYPFASIKEIPKAKELILEIIRSKKSQWTVQEIITQVDSQFGVSTIRKALVELQKDGQIILRKYRHNLYKYSVPKK